MTKKSISHRINYQLITNDVNFDQFLNSTDLLNIISTYSSSLVIGALSFIPGGIGIAEGSLIGLLTFQGIDISEAIVIVVLIRIFTLWFSTITGFIALKTSRSL